MEEKKASTLFEEMRDDVSNYVANTIELTKLQVYEKISKGSSVIAYCLIIVYLTLIALTILLITIGLYLGELLQSMWQGFGIVTLATFFILLILMLARKSMKRSITNRVVSFLMEQDDSANDKLKK